jgi:hypothetical protein
MPASAMKSHLLKVRLTANENQKIEDAAELATGEKRKKSEWARGVLLSEAETTVKKAS